MTIATLSRAARRARGVSQTQLAALTGLPASNISFIESGRRVPRVDTLESLLRRSGSRLTISPTLRTTALEASTEIRRWLVAGDRPQAFRTWLAFNDDLAAETPTNRVVLTAYPPEPTGDALYDAALAGLTEYRLGEVGAPLPPWVDSATQLDEPRVLSDSRYVTASSLGTIPDEFARRGVLIDAESLRSV
ncbi:MAG: helix-turn-helix transcriptional regulator [Microcella sp.]|uniref:helix-turn-helix domain-containing protein n=1 Tax=Microcella sp. TaxID=1913979 RepID=UPI00331501AA